MSLILTFYNTKFNVLQNKTFLYTTSLLCFEGIQIHNIISNVGYTQRLIENINEYHTMN